jgi:hypothetical protein
MFLAKNGTPKSTWICLLPVHQQQCKTLGLKHLRPPHVGATAGPPYGKQVYHWPDELLIEQNSVSDGEATSSVQDRTQHSQSLVSFLSNLIDGRRTGPLCIVGQPLENGLCQPNEWAPQTVVMDGVWSCAYQPLQRALGYSLRLSWWSSILWATTHR